MSCSSGTVKIAEVFVLPMAMVARVLCLLCSSIDVMLVLEVAVIRHKL